MRRIIGIAAAFCFLAASASAQTPSPIVAHYRAYQAALERDDLAGAETSATEALAAAEAGNDARIGALAFNLGALRLMRGNASGALAPAQRALALAHQYPGNGLSPTLANLLVARIELAQAVPDASARLYAALDAAQTAQLPASEISDAAIELALWSETNQRYDLALTTWSIADNFAEGSRYPEAFARARAKLGQAIAIIQAELSDGNRSHFDADNTADALHQLYEACRLLQDLAAQDLPSGEITLAQQTYAQVLAWSAVLRSKVRSDGMRLPDFAVAQGDADGMVEDIGAPASSARPRCMIQTAFLREIEFPSGAAARGELAGASVRLRINEAGELVDATVVAIVGSQAFVDAINRARWSVRRRADSDPNCRMEMSIIRSIAFSIEGNSGRPGRRPMRP